MDFVDKEKIQELSTRVTDALRHLGLTVEHMGYGLNPESGEMTLHVTAVVRPTAHEKLTEDLDSRDALASMMRGEHEITMKKRQEEIEKALTTGSIFDLDDDDEPAPAECEHKNVAEGLCLDCGHEDKGLYGTT